MKRTSGCALFSFLIMAVCSNGLLGLTDEDKKTIKEFIASKDMSSEQLAQLLTDFYRKLDEGLELFSGKGHLVQLYDSAAGHSNELKSFKMNLSDAPANMQKRFPHNQVQTYSQVKNIADKFGDILSNSIKKHRALIVAGLKNAVKPGFVVNYSNLENAVQPIEASDQMRQLTDETQAQIEELVPLTQSLKKQLHEQSVADIESFFTELEKEIA